MLLSARWTWIFFTQYNFALKASVLATNCTENLNNYSSVRSSRGKFPLTIRAGYSFAFIYHNKDQSHSPGRKTKSLTMRARSQTGHRDLRARWRYPARNSSIEQENMTDSIFNFLALPV